MRYDKDTDTDNNRDVEGMWSEQFRSSPSVSPNPPMDRDGRREDSGRG